MGKGKGKGATEGKIIVVPDVDMMRDDLGIKPKGWKLRCRTDEVFCIKLMLEWHWGIRKGRKVKIFNMDLIDDEMGKKWYLTRHDCYQATKEDMQQGKIVCWKLYGTHDYLSWWNCCCARERHLIFWLHEGPYSVNPRPPLTKGKRAAMPKLLRPKESAPRRRAANLAPGESTNVGVWVAVAVLLCLLLGAITAYFCLCREDKKKKKKGKGGSLSQKGSKAVKSSKLIGKSRISSRKSAKKSGKLGSLRSKSGKGGGGPSKGAKSRRSKSSAKSLKKK